MGLTSRYATPAAASLVWLVLLAASAGAQSGYPSTGFAAPPLPPAPPIRRLPEPLPPEAFELPSPAEETPPPAVDPPAESEPSTEQSVVVDPVVGDSLVDDSALDGAALGEVVISDPPPPPRRWYYPTTWFGPIPWDRGFELGINGSSGTSDTISIRTGGYIKRKTERNKLDLSLYYNKTKSDGLETQSNAILKARNDWLLGKSPWTVFLMSQAFYDEFQAFDVNVNVNSGIGYQFFDEEWVKFRTSVGLGAAREFGGVEDEWTPEAQFGFDWEQQISKMTRFYAGVDYFPELESWGDYRVLSEMGLEFCLSQPENVSLKLSATDRYDDNPNGVAPHNTNYSVLLLWKH